MKKNIIIEALRTFNKPELQEIKYNIDELIKRQTITEWEKIE